MCGAPCAALTGRDGAGARAATLGFHVAHLSGSTDRLLTYARGSALDAEQKAALGRERMIGVERPPVEKLVAAKPGETISTAGWTLRFDRIVPVTETLDAAIAAVASPVS